MKVGQVEAVQVEMGKAIGEPGGGGMVGGAGLWLELTKAEATLALSLAVGATETAEVTAPDGGYVGLTVVSVDMPFSVCNVGAGDGVLESLP